MPLRMRRPRRQAKGQSGEGNRDQNRVQKLYDSCRDTFITPTISSKPLLQLKDTLERVNSYTKVTYFYYLEKLLKEARFEDVFGVLDDKQINYSIKPEDVGLPAEGLVFGSEELAGILDNNHSSNALPVFYFGIHDCMEFTIGIFCLSESGVIPLHDHPGMTVLSKLLYGTMHVKAYDWIEPRSDADPTQRVVVEEDTIDSQTLGVALLEVLPLNFTVNGLAYRGQPIRTY